MIFTIGGRTFGRSGANLVVGAPRVDGVWSRAGAGDTILLSPLGGRPARAALVPGVVGYRLVSVRRGRPADILLDADSDWIGWSPSGRARDDMIAGAVRAVGLI